MMKMLRVGLLAAAAILGTIAGPVTRAEANPPTPYGGAVNDRWIEVTAYGTGEGGYWWGDGASGCFVQAHVWKYQNLMGYHYWTVSSGDSVTCTADPEDGAIEEVYEDPTTPGTNYATRSTDSNGLVAWDFAAVQGGGAAGHVTTVDFTCSVGSFYGDAEADCTHPPASAHLFVMSPVPGGVVALSTAYHPVFDYYADADDGYAPSAQWISWELRNSGNTLVASYGHDVASLSTGDNPDVTAPSTFTITTAGTYYLHAIMMRPDPYTSDVTLAEETITIVAQ